MQETGTFVKDLYCPKCDSRQSCDEAATLCPCGSPLLVDYDYDAAAAVLTRASLPVSVGSMWKYAPLLPIRDEGNIVSLGEGCTPLLKSVGLGKELGLPGLYFKDESPNPTGSFKARGLSAAVSKAKELGIRKMIIPTAGNAGSALAAYAARAGLDALIIMPKDVPEAFLIDADYHGAEIELVDGTIKDCGKRAAERSEQDGWFSIATLKEPYRIEGKKTMGYELAEQFNYELPDVIIYPTGGGTGLIGMWKAFDEMEKLGWIGGERPRMVSVQAEGCAPIPRAFATDSEYASEWENPSTVAAGLRVPSAVGDFLMLRAIRESKGTAVAVSDDALMSDSRALARTEGIFPAPEGGASLACLRQLLDSGFVRSHERVVVFITGSGYKYLDVLKNGD